MPQQIENDQAILRLEVCRKSYHDILCEIGRLKDTLEEIRRSPPHCYCSAVVYGSRIKAVEKEMREWQDLAREEEVEISRLEEIVKSKGRLSNDASARRE